LGELVVDLDVVVLLEVSDVVGEVGEREVGSRDVEQSGKGSYADHRSGLYDQHGQQAHVGTQPH